MIHSSSLVFKHLFVLFNMSDICYTKLQNLHTMDVTQHTQTGHEILYLIRFIDYFVNIH